MLTKWCVQRVSEILHFPNAFNNLLPAIEKNSGLILDTIHTQFIKLKVENWIHVKMSKTCNIYYDNCTTHTIKEPLSLDYN